ncbi:FtsX-like permease family protein [Micromonospora sp. WMMC415]|uniref:FtsX-like permease family protein n=1 Tax=Micromonospora sp. WMMC415 TaxID=2675222 RepID=UPI0012B4CA44|nr:FtsX-like permease family protein [Micromonospora sp. WMMC415]QGN48817.1 FtsX-like permease family protein [Micromonospora sp. WMMC415]
MRLALRRARGARGLLLAAAGATLVATAALTGLAAYNDDVVASGTASVLTEATAEERSILVRGPAGGTAEALRERDTTLREHVTAHLPGLDPTVTAAGYAAGRQLRGDTGSAVGDAGGTVYASVMFLDDLAAHARLTAGAWPQPGAGPVQAALAAPAAAVLGVDVGDRVPVTDGFTGRVTQVTVVGLFTPIDPADTYWRLAPEAATGTLPQSATYGPFTVHRDDFLAGFRTNASAGWLVEPDLRGVTGGAALDRLADGVTRVAATAPREAGLGDSGTALTTLDDLVQRLQRATLVGRSALVTPMLLVVVLGGYALLLVALLLTEHRRAETALLRARGAARAQLAGLAAREAALVVLPAAVLAPPLAARLLAYAERVPALAAVSAGPGATLTGPLWPVAALAAAGCLVAMLVPSLRGGGTYVADLASRSRPSRRGLVQRAGVDVVLVALAVLSWYQLRQYSSPLSRSRSGALDVDPLLAVAPTIGVLAGAVLALRLLPPLTRLAERWVDRKPWTATILGTWQAGRRPHAGPVLLLALAVAVATLAWTLSSTSQQSLDDQAGHRVGADLRLTELNGSAPDDRADQFAAVPGVEAVLATWRETIRIGPDNAPASVVAWDAGAAEPVVRMRPDLAGGSATELFGDLGRARVTAPHAELPAGARTLTGQLLVQGSDLTARVRSHAVLVEPHGGHRRLLLADVPAGEPVRFSVDLPAGAGPWRLAGFTAETVGSPAASVDWRLTDLRAGTDATTGTRVDLGGAGRWQVLNRGGPVASYNADGDGLTVHYTRSAQAGAWSIGGLSAVQFAIAPPVAAKPVPVVATPPALAALRLDVGAQTRLVLGGTEVDVRFVDVAESVPGGTERAAFLVDLPSLSTRVFHSNGLVRSPQEWWLTVRPAQREQAATAVGALGGLTVLDRGRITADLAREPFGVGARGALFAAALAAVLLAAVGVAVDVSATARRRATELAVLHTLGAGHRLVARSLLAEQGLLAGMGVLVGLFVGVGVAATMAPLVILTPAAQRPDPPPLLHVDWPPIVATGVGLLLLALAFSAAVSLTMRRRLAGSQLRIGEER